MTGWFAQAFGAAAAVFVTLAAGVVSLVWLGHSTDAAIGWPMLLAVFLAVPSWMFFVVALGAVRWTQAASSAPRAAWFVAFGALTPPLLIAVAAFIYGVADGSFAWELIDLQAMAASWPLLALTLAPGAFGGAVMSLGRD